MAGPSCPAGGCDGYMRVNAEPDWCEDCGTETPSVDCPDCGQAICAQCRWCEQCEQSDAHLRGRAAR